MVRFNRDGGIYITPATICPQCGATMVSETDLFMQADGKINDQYAYEVDLAEEMHGVYFKCTHCGMRSYIKETTLKHSDGSEQVYG